MRCTFSSQVHHTSEIFDNRKEWDFLGAAKIQLGRRVYIALRKCGTGACYSICAFIHLYYIFILFVYFLVYASAKCRCYFVVKALKHSFSKILIAVRVQFIDFFEQQCRYDVFRFFVYIKFMRYTSMYEYVYMKLTM